MSESNVNTDMTTAMHEYFLCVQSMARMEYDENDKMFAIQIIDCMLDRVDNDKCRYLCEKIVENNDVYEILKIAKPKRIGSELIVTTAASDMNSECLTKLLSIGYDVDTEDIYGNTPLLIAIINCDIDSVSIILEHNPDINHVNNDGWSALMCAFLYKRNDIASMLLNINDIDVNAQEHTYGLTSLMICNNLYNIEGVKMLLDHPRIDVNMQNSKGSTVMMNAIFGSSKEICELIMNSGKVDKNIKNNHGESVLSYAKDVAITRIASLVLTKETSNMMPYICKR